MMNWLLKLINPKRTPNIPDDGTAVPSGKPGEYVYKSPSQRMQDPEFEMSDMNPFTFSDKRPLLVKGGRPLKWEPIEKIDSEYVGLTVLKDESNNILLAIKYSTYLHAFEEGCSFFLYKRSEGIESHPQYLIIHALKTTNLKPITEDLKIFAANKDQAILYNCPTAEITKLPVEPNASAIEHTFFGELLKLPEFFVVADLKWIKEAKGNFAGTAILRVSLNRVELKYFLRTGLTRMRKLTSVISGSL